MHKPAQYHLIASAFINKRSFCFAITSILKKFILHSAMKQHWTKLAKLSSASGTKWNKTRAHKILMKNKTSKLLSRQLLHVACSYQGKDHGVGKRKKSAAAFANTIQSFSAKSAASHHTKSVNSDKWRNDSTTWQKLHYNAHGLEPTSILG